MREDDSLIWGMPADQVRADMLAERAELAVKSKWERDRMTPAELAAYQAQRRALEQRRGLCQYDD